MIYKRLITMAVLIALVISSSYADSLSMITDRASFETLFNIASAGFATSHSILSSKQTFTSGDVNDVYQMLYDEEDSFLQ